MKKIKSFKLGEYALGGIIKVTKGKNIVTIQALDYKDKKQIIDSATLPKYALHDIELYLNYLTTCYYSDIIMHFIKN